jgi:tetratricopeptide (TPR) repeat protein
MSRLRRFGPLLAIVGIALALRVAYFVTYTGHPEFRTPMLDSEWFHEQALAIRAGDWNAHEATFRGPLYPLFLAGVYLLTRPDPAAARLVQLLLGGLTVLLVAHLGRRLFGAAAGIVSGVLAAFYWILIYYEGEILIESLLPLLTVLVLLSLLRADRSGSLGRHLLAGALLALFAAARPNILLFLPAAVVWCGVRGTRKGIALLVGALLLLAPITIRNRIVTGEWVAVSTQGGINFYIGNQRDSDGIHAVFPGLPSWRNEDVTRLTAARLGRSPTENEVSRYWFREGLKEIAADPVHFAKGIGRKSLLLFTSYEIGNNRDIVLFRRSNPLLSLPFVSFAVLFPLALAGFLYGSAPRREALLLAAFLLFYGLSVVLFFVCARFRVPMLIPLFPFAARGLVLLSERARERSLRTLAPVLGVFLAANIGSSLDPFHVHEVAEGQEAFHRGNVEARRGNADQAIEAYREAIGKASGLAGAHYHLGVVLVGEGREEEGLRELVRAMELDPNNPRIPLFIGERMAERGAIDQAETLYRRSLAADAYFPDAYVDLGALLAGSGRTAEAEPLLRRALELDPENGAGLVDLGKLYASAGRDAEAEPLLAKAIRVAPERKDAWFEWGNLLFRRGRAADAAEAFRRAARLAEDDIASYMNLSLALRTIGDREGATLALREVLRIDPGNEAARKRLEDLEGRSGGRAGPTAAPPLPPPPSEPPGARFPGRSDAGS